MKSKIYHFIKIVERDEINTLSTQIHDPWHTNTWPLTNKYMTPNRQIHDRSFYWLDTPNTQIHHRSFSGLIPLTHKYMTVHFPGLIHTLLLLILKLSLQTCYSRNHDLLDCYVISYCSECNTINTNKEHIFSLIKLYTWQIDNYQYCCMFCWWIQTHGILN